MAERGETLSEVQLAQCRPVRGEGGRAWRAFCPFHGGDRQRSLRVDAATGRFECFACGVWGYTERAREEFQRAKTQGLRGASTASTASMGRVAGNRFAVAQPAARPGSRPAPFAGAQPSLPPPLPPALREDLPELLAGYQASLPGSPGADYLEERGIPLALAQSFGLGYAAPGQWAHRRQEDGRPVRDYAFGRLVMPHTDPEGRVVNLYGRALGERAPKALRHDHLPGPKGYFHAAALNKPGPLYICEGPFDALSLVAARPEISALAIFGVRGWRFNWPSPQNLVFALDSDQAGQTAWKALARQLLLRGKKVEYLPAAAYGGAKDINEAWVEGVLQLG